MTITDLKHVVVVGHDLAKHPHTHGYIHSAFVKAFKAMGADAQWWANDYVPPADADLAGTLFISEGQVDGHVPARDDCWYVLHNCYDNKYRDVAKRVLRIQTFTLDIVDRYLKPKQDNIRKLAPYLYYETGGDFPMLYMPWATDLLPDEFSEVSYTHNRSKMIWWVGTIGGGEFGNIHQIQPFVTAALQAGVGFRPMPAGTSDRQHRDLIRRSFVAPAIVGDWQLRKGYVPCRIFKNISYGQMGLSNSPTVGHMFDCDMICDPDGFALFNKAAEARGDIERIKTQMAEVKEKHTYFNRINTLLELLG